MSLMDNNKSCCTTISHMTATTEAPHTSMSSMRRNGTDMNAALRARDRLAEFAELDRC
jgi:hypothetical protein